MTAERQFVKNPPHYVDLLKSIPRFAASLPLGVKFENDVWNLAALGRQAKAKKSNIPFVKICNPDLRLLAKIRVAELIAHKGIGPRQASLICKTFMFLAEALQARAITNLTSNDFHTAGKLFRSTKSASRISSELARTCVWLNQHLRQFLVYTAMKPDEAVYGRKGTEEGRREKLIPNAVLAQMLSHRVDPSISKRDRFYLSTIAIVVSTGLRISELMTLPFDCLICDERALLLRNFPAKNGRESTRPVVAALREVVEDAVAFIKSCTEGGRKLARKQMINPSIDWHHVFASDDSTVVPYFVRRWAKDFIEHPNNRLLDGRMAWSSLTSTWLPIENVFEKHNGNISAMSRELGAKRATIHRLLAQTKAARHGEIFLGTKDISLKSFDTDRRVVSIEAFQRTTGFRLVKRAQVALILEEAAWAQIRQTKFKAMRTNLELESDFRINTCILRNPDTQRVVLAAQDALFVTFRQELSQQATDYTSFSVIGPSHLNSWLTGYARDRGTGKETDSFLHRFKIIDPQTTEVAKFTVSDIRHWLNTAYEDGGLTQDQIAVLFNRHSTTANAGYQHTAASARSSRLEQAIRNGIAVGHVAAAHASLAKESPAEAEAFLAAATRFYNPMPHGVCLLNWAAEVCPHTLSCFSCGGDASSEPKLCEYLIVDRKDPEQVAEIDRINRNAKSITLIMAEDGMTKAPQFAHFDSIRKSTDALLGEIED